MNGLRRSGWFHKGFQLVTRTLLLVTVIFVFILASLPFSPLIPASPGETQPGLESTAHGISTEEAKAETEPADLLEPEASLTPYLQLENTPEPTTPEEDALPSPVPWTGNTRVNILVLGLDYGDTESADRDGPARSDTMVLLTVDPASKTAGILSIPRDLWVDIPGMIRPNKINAAHRFGEMYRLPGGGPGLAMRTVEELLGVPIDYYIRVDFQSFVRLIDEMDGIKVDVPEEISIDLLGDGANTKKKLKPGVQVLPGEWALAYARARNTKGGDFDRSKRQHQVILAIRDRVLNLDLLPRLILNAPGLYREVSSGVQTNLSLDKAIRLAWLAIQIPPEQVLTGAIGPNEVRSDQSEDGQSISRPVRERIDRLVAEMFATSAPAAGPTPSPQDRAIGEDTRLYIVNGTGEDELSERTAEYLESLGLVVTGMESSTERFEKTTIVDTKGKPHTVRYLAKVIGIPLSDIKNEFDENEEVDVVLMLGPDWARRNSLPDEE